MSKIVRPKVEANLPSIKKKGFIVKHCVGIDAGTALIVRGGVHGTNDLVSVGRAPNVAAKLSDIRNDPWRTYVTEIVFNRLISAKCSSGSERELMWVGPYPREVGGEKMDVYKSSWRSKP